MIYRRTDVPGLIDLSSAGVSQVVSIDDGQLSFFTGQMGIDENGKLEDFRAGQIERAFSNLEAQLDSCSAKWEHVVKLNVYIVDMEKSDMELLSQLRKKYFRGLSPACSTIGVSGLSISGAIFEIEAVVHSHS